MKHLSLREEDVVADLRAADSEDALRKLVNALPAWRADQVTKDRIWESLVVRERLGTTAIGRGIALPHCFSPDVTDPMVVFGVSPEGIPYSSLDGCPVHFIFVLILPQTESAERTKREILQNIKWFLFDRFLQERLKMARAAHEIFALLSLNPERETVLSKAA